ncbi:transporter [Streptosporangium violaceochromogenes]|nr:transporter [Streptosporangium violaceochromogenes]
MSGPAPSSPATGGVALGVTGVIAFSLTLPVTRYAVPAFGPELVGPGRALLAAVFAVAVLVVSRRPLFPPVRRLPSVLVIALGSVIGFPLLVAHALRTVSAGHAAVVIALLPAATAVMGVLRAGERPQRRFWCWCVVGTALVAGYLACQADTGFGAGDLELIGAVLLCALGYAEGGVLSKLHPGWVVTCWSLVVGSPAVVAVILAVGLPARLTFTASTVLAFAYLAIGSSLLAFFAWYRALALGGIAKTGQIQLLQPIFTMLFAVVLLGEPLDPVMLGVGFLVGLTVLMAQRSRVAAAPSAPSRTPSAVSRGAKG